MKRYILKYKFVFFITIILQFVAGIGDVLVTILLKYGIDIVNENNMSKFLKFIIFAIGIIIVVYSISCFNRILKASFRKKVFINMKEDFFYGLFNMSIKDFRNSNTGEYISLINNDVKILEEDYFNVIFKIIYSVAIALFSLIASFKISVKLTIILTSLSVIPILVPTLFGKLISKYKINLSDSMSKFNNKFKDILNGYEVIKSFNIEKRLYDEYDKVNVGVEHCRYKCSKIEALVDHISTAMIFVVYFISIGFSGYLVLKNEITLGSMIAAVNLVGNIINPLGAMASYLNSIKSTKLIQEKIFKIIDMPKTDDLGISKSDFHNKITFENVAFYYEAEKYTLKNINLEIEKNKKYAIVGESGCGKSTLINLLLKYNELISGDIRIDNTSIKNINTKSLNNLVSLIQQNNIIFDGTIKDNITLYKEYEEEVLNKCIKSIELEELIKSLPKGIDSLTGEAGYNLSGGEKQRISLARAVLKNSEILVLDESTSALDNQTAYSIENLLLSLENLTMIVITHKLVESILTKYDKIIAMRNGEIIESGNFYELIEKKGYFYELYYAEYKDNVEVV